MEHSGSGAIVQDEAPDPHRFANLFNRMHSGAAAPIDSNGDVELEIAPTPPEILGGFQQGEDIRANRQFRFSLS